MTKEECQRSKDDAWVDILVASHSRRAGNQDERFAVPGALDHATLVVKTQKSRAKEWLRFSQEFVALHPRSMVIVSTSSR